LALIIYTYTSFLSGDRGRGFGH